MKRHVKNHFNFNDYLSIFERTQEDVENLFKEDMFEIECVAHEASLLKDYISKVNAQAKKFGRKVLVVPNLSYGYLPTAPIIEELKKEGVEFLIGTKVGSTESHNNKEVMVQRLLKGRRTEVINEQPIIIVVDGTKHLLARDENNRSARYPDAYQGFLNEMISMNDSLGFKEADYSHLGKTKEDMGNLRENPTFQRAVEVYTSLLGKANEGQEYTYHFWNTAGMTNLIIRNYHKALTKAEPPIDPKNIKGPAMIYCNVGVLDTQIPKKIRSRYPGNTHEPAHFDDSGKIIAFDFGCDEYGVRYLNRLETEVKKAYNANKGRVTIENDFDVVPAIIKYKRKNPDAAQPEEKAA